MKLYDDPVVVVSQIKEEKDTLDKSAWTVLNKPKPKLEPPKQEESKQKAQEQQSNNDKQKPNENGKKQNEESIDVD